MTPPTLMLVFYHMYVCMYVDIRTLGDNEAYCTHEMSCKRRRQTVTTTKGAAVVSLTLSEVLTRQDGVKRCDQSSIKDTAFFTSLSCVASAEPG